MFKKKKQQDFNHIVHKYNYLDVDVFCGGQGQVATNLQVLLVYI